MKTSSISSMACAPGALDGGPVRTRFFDGMFLTQADLENEQRYWRLKRRLTNRALGAGVVWGLRLVWQSDKRMFQLAPGYAIDCCGNDLVVECPTQISERELWSRADPSLLGNRFGTSTGPLQGGPPPRIGILREATSRAYRGTFTACVVLQYTECGEEPRTVQGDACAGPTGMCELSRVRETARLLLVPPPMRRETPPELFLDDLKAFHDSLPASLQGKVFPPQGGPSTTPSSATPPVTLTVKIPGATTTDVINFPAAGQTANGAPFSGTQNVSGSQTGVVTFELNPFSGWGFTSGSVTDQGRTVETVTPPSAPSMFWSLDVALPPATATAGATTSVGFDYLVQGLQVAQQFGGSQSGTIDAEIYGTVIVSTSGQGAVSVTLDQLVVKTTDATVGVGTGGNEGCLDLLLPWGWTIDPANGSKIARVLVLAAMYALLQEAVATSPSFAQPAAYAYQVLWYALFDVDVTADPSGQTLASVSALLQKLFQRWCDGFAYPGPRCLDEHHGVYLGCAELDSAGNVLSFDMWTNRRYVLTGPLLAHWANQLGIASLDVIVGRFVDVLCCLASQPAFGWNQTTGTTGTTGVSSAPGAAPTNVKEYTYQVLHVGTPATLATFAQGNNATVRYVGLADLAARVVQAFTAPAGTSKEVLALQLDDGGTIGLLVPTTGNAPAQDHLTGEVTAQLKSAGDAHVIARSRPLVASFVTGVLASAPASSLVPENAPAATQQLAKLLDAKGVTVAELATSAPSAVLARAGASSTATLAPGADDLVDRAELAVSAVTAATVKAVGSAADASTFTDTAKQKALAKALVAVVPKLAAATVTTAAAKAARGS